VSWTETQFSGSLVQSYDFQVVRLNPEGDFLIVPSPPPTPLCLTNHQNHILLFIIVILRFADWGRHWTVFWTKFMRYLNIVWCKVFEKYEPFIRVIFWTMRNYNMAVIWEIKWCLNYCNLMCEISMLMCSKCICYWYLSKLTEYNITESWSSEYKQVLLVIVLLTYNVIKKCVCLFM